MSESISSPHSINGETSAINVSETENRVENSVCPDDSFPVGVSITFVQDRSSASPSIQMEHIDLDKDISTNNDSWIHSENSDDTPVIGGKLEGDKNETAETSNTKELSLNQFYSVDVNDPIPNHSPPASPSKLGTPRHQDNLLGIDLTNINPEFTDVEINQPSPVHLSSNPLSKLAILSLILGIFIGAAAIIFGVYFGLYYYHHHHNNSNHELSPTSVPTYFPTVYVPKYAVTLKAAQVLTVDYCQIFNNF